MSKHEEQDDKDKYYGQQAQAWANPARGPGGKKHGKPDTDDKDDKDTKK